MIRKVLRAFALIAAAALLSACSGDPRSAAGFSLPEGDAERGRSLFVDYGCNACHAVEGVPRAEDTAPVTVELGGRVSRVKSYGELLSAIVNPSHRTPPRYPRAKVTRDGESLMTVYNDVMTVQDLIDLVAFLESTYQVVKPRLNYEPYSYERWLEESGR